MGTYGSILIQEKMMEQQAMINPQSHAPVDYARKLRRLAMAMYVKLLKNRFKPTKWAPEGLRQYGHVVERTWNTVNPLFLSDKLNEEFIEVQNVLSDVIDQDNRPNHNTRLELMNETADLANLAMMAADRFDALWPELEVPLVVCLCGSTKFKDAWLAAQLVETLKGHIVLSVGWFSHADAITFSPSPEEKVRLDWLHKRKIDLADEIYVMNVGGYIGESTRSEIAYAQETCKPVRYLEPLP